MSVGDVVYAAYARRVARQLKPAGIPRHVGVMLDGNRRWAKERGGSTAQGHQAGADNIANLLSWCEEIGVEVVTLWLLSTDNLARPAGELRPLLGQCRFRNCRHDREPDCAVREAVRTGQMDPRRYAVFRTLCAEIG